MRLGSSHRALRNTHILGYVSPSEPQTGLKRKGQPVLHPENETGIVGNDWRPNRFVQFFFILMNDQKAFKGDTTFS